MKELFLDLCHAANFADLTSDIIDQYHYLMLFSSAAFVPEGHLKIARRFNAGVADGACRVPKGRLKHVRHFSRPSGTRIF